MGQRNNQAGAQPGAYPPSTGQFLTMQPGQTMPQWPGAQQGWMHRQQQPAGQYDPNVSYAQGAVPTQAVAQAQTNPFNRFQQQNGQLWPGNRGIY